MFLFPWRNKALHFDCPKTPISLKCPATYAETFPSSIKIELKNEVAATVLHGCKPLHLVLAKKMSLSEGILDHITFSSIFICNCWC
jgi:hypothetical protein